MCLLIVSAHLCPVCHVPVNFSDFLGGGCQTPPLPFQNRLGLGGSAVPVGTCKPGWHWAGRCPEEWVFSKSPDQVGVQGPALPAFCLGCQQLPRANGTASRQHEPVQCSTFRSLKWPSAIGTKSSTLSPEDLQLHLMRRPPLDQGLFLGTY